MPDGYLDMDTFIGRAEFTKNLTELAELTCAAGNEDRRKDELQKMVGYAADHLNIGEECRSITRGLIQILVEMPSDDTDSQDL